MRRLALLLLAALLTAGLAGCEATREAANQATGADEPAPTHSPVNGDPDIEIVDVAPAPVVPGGAGAVTVPGVKRRQAQQFGAATARWLDEHLTRLQAGEELGRLADSGLVGAAPGPSPGRGLTAATTALANPDQPVRNARYAIRIAARGGPEWAQARVVVTDASGAEHAADFIFTAARGGPRPVAAGVRPVEGR